MPQWAQWCEQMQAMFATQPTLATLVYFSVFTALSALCLPGAGALMLMGGVAMGLGWCVALSNLASALGALITFWLARYFFSERARRAFPVWMARCARPFEKSPALFITAMRLMPVVPYAPLNIISGLMPVKATVFFLSSFLGMLPGTLAYVHAGRVAATWKDWSDLVSLETLTAAAIVLGVTVLPIGLHRVRQRLFSK